MHSINVKKNEAKLHTLEASIKTKQGLHTSMMSVQEQLDKKNMDEILKEELESLLDNLK